MMPLTLANVNETNIIKKVGGLPETKKHLENLGFVVGASEERAYSPKGRDKRQPWRLSQHLPSRRPRGHVPSDIAAKPAAARGSAINGAFDIFR